MCLAIDDFMKKEFCKTDKHYPYEGIEIPQLKDSKEKFRNSVKVTKQPTITLNDSQHEIEGNRDNAEETMNR